MNTTKTPAMTSVMIRRPWFGGIQPSARFGSSPAHASPTIASNPASDLIQILRPCGDRRLTYMPTPGSALTEATASRSNTQVGGVRAELLECRRNRDSTSLRLNDDGNPGNGPGGCSMQRALVTTSAAMIMTALALSAAGCGGSPMAGAPPTVHAPASDKPTAVTKAGAKEAEVFVRVLRRYLSTPAENSFPGRAFKMVYVLDQAYPDAADPHGTHGRGAPIAPQTQRQVTAGLAGMARVIFVADRGSVIEARNGCELVRNGGILMTLGTPVSHGHEMRVGINGFVACLGATWLTYVLQDQPGAGWRVTGTTGSMAIS